MKRTTFGLRLDDAIRDRLVRLAKQRGMKAAELARLFIAGGIDREEAAEGTR